MSSTQCWHGMVWAEYLDRGNKALSPIYSMGRLGDQPDPDNLLRMAVPLCSARHHERYIEAIELARRTLDQQARMNLYRQAQRTPAEAVALLPPGQACVHLLIKPRVKQYPVSAIGQAFWKDVVIEPH